MTLASRDLRLAQPTVSTQLKYLEDSLGEKLFFKEGRNLKLTEAGQVAYKYAEQIFGLGSQLLDALSGVEIGEAKELRIGLADVVPKSMAYRLIGPALEVESRTTVYCFEDKTERLLADLSIGELDLVIADRPIPPNVKVKAFNHFIGECSVSFMAERSIAKRLRRGFPSSLKDAPLILPTLESAVRHEIDRWFELKGITPRCIAAFQDRALMKLAARDGKGAIPVPSVVTGELKREFHLDIVGEASEIKEQIFLITIERKLKNPLVSKISSLGQRLLKRPG